MAITTTQPVNSAKKVCYKYVMTANADTVIVGCKGAKTFSLDVKGVTADTIELWFTNASDAAPAAGDWKQWKTSAGVNPWVTANDLARGSIDYTQLKLVRTGGVDGDITAVLCMSL